MTLADKDGNSQPVLIRRILADQIPGFYEERINMARLSEAAEGGD